MTGLKIMIRVVATLAAVMLVSCDEEVTAPKDEGFLEPSVQIPMVRQGWYWASLPVRGPGPDGNPRTAFQPGDRAYQGWHRAVGSMLQKSHTNPYLSDREKREIYTTLEMRLVSRDLSGWHPDEFAGIVRSIMRVDYPTINGAKQRTAVPNDLTDVRFFEFWIDDGTGYVDPTDETALRESRPGRLHFDFGQINEDFWWQPDGAGGYVLGEWDKEDLDNDGLLGIAEDGETEDRGLDRLLNDQESPDHALPGRAPRGEWDPAGDDYDAADTDDYTFIYINGTQHNQRLDSEDISSDGVFDLADGFFRFTLELDSPDALIDPAYIYADNPDFIQDMRNGHRSWRLYMLDMRDVIPVTRGVDLDEPDVYGSVEPDLSQVNALRIWYEPEGDGSDPPERRIKFAEMRFIQNPRPQVGLR